MMSDGRRTRRRWRWSNVPVPEPHVAGLLAGLVLHASKPQPLTEGRRFGRIRTAVGLASIVVGIATAAWAVRSAGNANLERPTALVTDGPYTYSRNPMYVAWTVLYAGVALLSNAAWPLVLLPPVAVASHLGVRREERELERAFGVEYREYRRDVPRYL